MRILSWDVGLKTLSYCLLRVERVSNNAVNMECNPVKSEETGENAIKKSEGTTQCIVERWETIDVPSEYFVRVDPIQCQTVPVKGAKRVKRTLKTETDVPLERTTTETQVLPRKRAVRQTSAVSKKLTLEQSVEAVHQSLSRRVSFLLCEGAMPDAITIEQQPAGGHNRFSSVNMKVISHVIQAYFYNLVDTSRCTISFVSPASKLVEMRESDRKKTVVTTVVTTADEIHQTQDTVSRTLMGQRYRRNKQFAVAKTQELLCSAAVHNDYAVGVLKAAGKKKDDLCDAFLLGYYYGIKNLINHL